MSTAKSHLTHLVLIALLALNWSPRNAKAGQAFEIDAAVHATLDQFYHEVGSARELSSKAVGILVFPSVVVEALGF